MHVIDLDFVSNSQQTLECIAKEVEIQPLPPPLLLDDSNQLLPPLVGFRVSGESTDHVTSNLKSTFVSVRLWLYIC